MPVGPLALQDEVSLSLALHVMNQTRKDFQAEGKAYREHPGEAVIRKMVEQLDRPGKKAGRGFYDYPEGGKKRLWPGLAEHWPVKAEPLSQQEMIDRLLYVQANETARCYEEGVLRSVPDANIGSIFGWGFAPFHGGTLQFINSVGGSRAFIARAHELAGGLRGALRAGAGAVADGRARRGVSGALMTRVEVAMRAPAPGLE